jgi:acylphosphatase
MTAGERLDRMRLFAVVSGRVQGVGFRAFVVREARRLGLTGWVRNRSDGAVEVLAEGPERKLRELAALLRRGPPAAIVERLDCEWGAAGGERPGFNVDY